MKRSFNRLLRQFKPERAPEEFQRIRAAYEQLDNSLRYGEQTFAKRPVEDMFNWTAAVQESEQAPPNQKSQRATEHDSKGDQRSGTQDRQPSRSPQELIVERLQTATPDRIYVELSKIEDKTPFDFYALPVLIDALENTYPLRFVKWILAGLKKFPN